MAFIRGVLAFHGRGLRVGSWSRPRPPWVTEADRQKRFEFGRF